MVTGLGLVLLAGSPLAGAQVQSDATAAGAVEIEIPVFAGGYGAEFFVETARAFEEERPGNRVQLYGDPRIADKLRVRAIDGSYPDATLSGGLLWPALIQGGKVVDLTPYLDGPNWEGDARWGDTFQPGALESWRLDGRVYGLPFAYSCWTIFYNRALFRTRGWSEPRTWDEFFALCDAIKSANLAPLALPGTRGLYPEAFLRAAYYNLAGAEGWRALNSLAPGARLDPRYLRAAALLQRVTQNYTMRGWEGATHTGAQLAFLEGRAAMTVSGSWFIHEMRTKLPPDFELGTMNFPVFPEGIADASTIQTGSDCFFVFATGNAVRERATIDFLRFLTSRANAAAFVRRVDAPVAIRGVPLEAYAPIARDTGVLVAQARDAFDMPQDMLQPPAIRQTMIDARLKLMTRAFTPREFGERLEAAAANDRARAAQPDLVEPRHPAAATALLAGLSAIAVWFLWNRWRTKASAVAGLGEAGPGSTTPATGDTMLGPMRPRVAAGFVGPAFVLYAAFVLLPGLAACGWAFTRWDGIGTQRWAGLFNFKWLLLESDVFWTALGNNFFLMVVPALVVVPVALFCATLIHRGVWGAGAFRVVLLFPNLLGGVAAMLLWLNAYEPNGGLVNAALVALGRVTSSAWLQSFDGFPWLAPNHLYWALVPVYLWMACGFNLILYLAAMQGVPGELYEAAELDGVPRWRQFFFVTLPLIWEVIVISAVFLVIGGLNAFEAVWLLTSQDPVTSVHTLSTLLVSTMFKEFAIGRATALAVILFLLVLAGTALVMRVLRRETVEA